MATSHQINALTKLAKANSGLPILSQVKLEKGRMMATDLSVAIIIEDDDIIETGYINGAKLKKAGVAVAQKHWPLVNNNKEYKAEDWPELPQGEAPVALSEETVNAMIEALVTASKDDTRPVLTTIELRADGHVSSTDGYRLFTRNTGHDLTALVPSQMVELMKMTKLTRDWSIGSNSDSITLQNGRFKMIGRVIDGNYPEWDKLIPAKAETRVQVKAALLKEALDLIDGGNIRIDPNGTVYVTDGDKKSMIAIARPEKDVTLNKADMHVVMPLKDAPNTVMLNSRYVNDAAGKAEYIRFSFSGGLSPVIVEGLEK